MTEVKQETNIPIEIPLINYAAHTPAFFVLSADGEGNVITVPKAIKSERFGSVDEMYGFIRSHIFNIVIYNNTYDKINDSTAVLRFALLASNERMSDLQTTLDISNGRVPVEPLAIIRTLQKALRGVYEEVVYLDGAN